MFLINFNIKNYSVFEQNHFKNTTAERKRQHKTVLPLKQKSFYNIKYEWLFAACCSIACTCTAFAQ